MGVLVCNACTEYTMASHYIKSPMGHDVHVHVCIEDHSYASLGHYMYMWLYAHVPTNAQLTDYTRNCNILHAWYQNTIVLYTACMAWNFSERQFFVIL